MNSSNTSKKPALRTVGEMAKRHPIWSPASLRYLIFSAEPRINSRGETIEGNGLAPAIIRLGRRVLIDEEEFFRWVEKHRCGERSKEDERRAA